MPQCVRGMREACARHKEIETMARGVSSLKDKRAKRAEYSSRNPRVRQVSANEWIVGRTAKLKVSLRFAAAAKSYRTAVGVTQGDMGRLYGITSSSVARWESGFFFGWTDQELANYCRDCDAVAGEKNGGNS